MWNISQAFRDQLRNPNQQVAARATLLSSDFKEIPDGDFFTAGADDFQDFIVDGNIDIDRDRGTRRTAELTLLNKDGQFTPDGDATDYDGKFYVNRVVRIYRGVVVGGQTALYAPAGTFMIDSIDIIVERNMSVVNLTLSDMWKKLNKSLFLREKTFVKGTSINEIIRDQAGISGADYPLAPALDPLTGPERTVNNTTLQKAMSVNRGSSRGDFLKEMCNAYGIDIYFNQEGRLVTNDRKDPRDSQQVWHFYSSTSQTQLGMLNSVRRTISDDNFYNHVYVVGLGDPKNPVIYNQWNSDPTNFGNVNRLGDRTKILESETWKTQTQVDTAGKRLWDKRFNLFEEVVIDTICNPALESDDVIRVTEPLSRLDALYRIIQFNVPLTTSKQTIRMTRNYSW